VIGVLELVASLLAGRCWLMLGGEQLRYVHIVVSYSLSS
jgi:hypothetical protein